MHNQYFVKFIEPKYVTVAKAKNTQEATVLKQNQYEPCDSDFYNWVITNTQPLPTTKQ